jgi:hypothetical protein
MSDKTRGVVTMARRRFLLTCVAATGSGAMLGYLGGGLRRRQSTAMSAEDSVVLVRNPAFTLRTDAGADVIATSTGDGRTLAYRLDEQGRFLWDSIPSVEALPETAPPTVGSLIAKAVERYGYGRPEATATDAGRFVKEALAAGVFMVPSARVYRAYEAPRKA